MNIEDIKVTVYPTKNEESSLKAFVSLTIGDAMAVRGLRVVSGVRGLLIFWPREWRPAEKNKLIDSEKEQKPLRNIVFPISREASKALEARILSVYRETIGKARDVLANDNETRFVPGAEKKAKPAKKKKEEPAILDETKMDNDMDGQNAEEDEESNAAEAA